MMRIHENRKVPRVVYAEFLAAWCGGVRTADIKRMFMTTHRLASQAIQTVMNSASARRRGHSVVMSREGGDALGVLCDIFSAHRLSEGILSGYVPEMLGSGDILDDCDFTEAYAGIIDGDVLSAILTALRSGSMVLASYYSRDGRRHNERLTPARLRKIGGRVYLRSYFHSSERWHDFLVARFLSVEIVGGYAHVPDDVDWNERADIRFRLNENLPPARRKLAQLEWKIEDELVFRNVRLCDHFFLCRRFEREEMNSQRVWKRM